MTGALITAELAADQGREVLAVPGNIDSQYNMGTNQLIREGAQAVTSVDDVLDFLGLAPTPAKPVGRLSQTEGRVYQMLEQRGEMSADEIGYHLSCSPAYLMPILSSLELKGHITSAEGKFFLANR